MDELNGKANTNHTHNTSQISGLQSYVENVISQSGSNNSLYSIRLSSISSSSTWSRSYGSRIICAIFMAYNAQSPDVAGIGTCTLSNLEDKPTCIITGNTITITGYIRSQSTLILYEN